MLALAYACALLLLAAGAQGQSIPVSFNHGVASGDPLSDRVILWTRVTPRETNATKLAGMSIPVTWVVSSKPSFATVQATGKATATADSDFTVKVDAQGGLKPEVTYYYKFVAGLGLESPVGQFRLPPPAGKPLEQLRYAIFSCSNWGWGYFNAYDAATRYDLDFSVHLGDYIYEYGADTYPAPDQAVRFQPGPLGLQPPTEAISLADYRARHALYRQDPGLQALSASAPMIAAWDDHETANDSWMDGAENHQPNEGSWAVRKAAAIRAYHEWMPTRVPDPKNPISFYRSFQFGNLATLLMLETRLLARTNPVPGKLPDAFTTVGAMGFAALPPSQWTKSMADAAKAFAAQGDAIRNSPDRQILGAQQLAWIKSTIKDSLARGTTWQLYGQDTVMLGQIPPDLEKAAATAKGAKKQLWSGALANLTGAGAASTTVYTKTARWSYLQGLPFPVSDAIKAGVRVVLALARYRVNFNFDCWSGYQAEKARFLKAVTGGAADAKRSNKLNAVIYGGDSHNAWAGVQSVNGSVVATEFDGMGVTSPLAHCCFEDYFPFVPTDLMAAGFLASNPDLVYSNIEDKGFMLVTLTQQKHRLEMLKVSTIASMKYQLQCDAAFESIKQLPCQPPERGQPYSGIMPLNSGLARYSSALP
ncbi:hypothetical protein ABPG77_003612 [Micractinium sp. CCAP 211/92]